HAPTPVFADDGYPRAGDIHGREPASGLRHLWPTCPPQPRNIRTADSQRQRKHRNTYRYGGTEVPTARQTPAHDECSVTKDTSRCPVKASGVTIAPLQICPGWCVSHSSASYSWVTPGVTQHLRVSGQPRRWLRSICTRSA